MGHAGQRLGGLEALARLLVPEGLDHHLLDAMELVEATEVQKLAEQRQAFLQGELKEEALLEHLDELGLQAQFFPLQETQDELCLVGVLPRGSEARREGADQAGPLREVPQDVLDGALELGPGDAFGEGLAGGGGKHLPGQRPDAQGQTSWMLGQGGQAGEQAQLDGWR